MGEEYKGGMLCYGVRNIIGFLGHRGPVGGNYIRLSVGNNRGWKEPPPPKSAMHQELEKNILYIKVRNRCLHCYTLLYKKGGNRRDPPLRPFVACDAGNRKTPIHELKEITHNI